jgi:hypothetical protein
MPRYAKLAIKTGKRKMLKNAGKSSFSRSLVYMNKILFICHGNISKNLGKAYKINDFMVWSGTYYTTTTPFLKEP